jgi:hypothetical protein
MGKGLSILCVGMLISTLVNAQRFPTFDTIVCDSKDVTYVIERMSRKSMKIHRSYLSQFGTNRIMTLHFSGGRVDSISCIEDNVKFNWIVVKGKTDPLISNFDRIDLNRFIIQNYTNWQTSQPQHFVMYSKLWDKQSAQDLNLDCANRKLVKIESTFYHSSETVLDEFTVSFRKGRVTGITEYRMNEENGLWLVFSKRGRLRKIHFRSSESGAFRVIPFK